MLGIRIIFTAICIAAGFHFRPFSVSKEYGSAVGLLFAIAVILFELRLRRASLRRLIGAATGSILGIVGAYFTTLVLSHTSMPESTRSFFSLATDVYKRQRLSKPNRIWGFCALCWSRQGAGVSNDFEGPVFSRCLLYTSRCV